MPGRTLFQNPTPPPNQSFLPVPIGLFFQSLISLITGASLHVAHACDACDFVFSSRQQLCSARRHTVLPDFLCLQPSVRSRGLFTSNSSHLTQKTASPTTLSHYRSTTTVPTHMWWATTRLVLPYTKTTNTTQTDTTQPAV